MIGGLPWTAWLLIAAATLPALILALIFYIAHRDERHPGAPR